jgi:hypothetical protein
MIKVDDKSNAQSWELEVTCKNKTYLEAVVSAILKYGMIEFEVNIIDCITHHDGEYDARYTVLMWCSWFHNLKNISKDLAKIEKQLEP